MDFSLAYLLQRFFYRIFDFFHHWYVDGSRMIGHTFITTLQHLDRTFALRVMFRHFFEPLYGDYSVVGRVLGAIFRTFRIFIALMIYLFLACIALAVYVFWIALPPYIIFRIIHG